MFFKKAHTIIVYLCCQNWGAGALTWRAGIELKFEGSDVG